MHADCAVYTVRHLDKVDLGNAPHCSPPRWYWIPTNQFVLLPTSLFGVLHTIAYSLRIHAWDAAFMNGTGHTVDSSCRVCLALDHTAQNSSDASSNWLDLISLAEFSLHVDLNID